MTIAFSNVVVMVTMIKSSSGGLLRTSLIGIDSWQMEWRGERQRWTVAKEGSGVRIVWWVGWLVSCWFLSVFLFLFYGENNSMFIC
jgi:hypothetical protein